MDDYLKFLTSLLSDLDLTVDNNDYVRYNDSSRSPVLVEGRRLVLPTDPHRRNPSDENLIFHPLAENTVADISPLLKELLRQGAVNLNILFTTHAIEIAQVASDVGRQGNLTDSQIDLLSRLKSCKSSDEKNVAKIVQDILFNHSRQNEINGFVQLGLSRGRNYRGEKRSRVCSVTFPFYEWLSTDEEKAKHKSEIPLLTKDIRSTLIELHEVIFPAVAEEEAYGYVGATARTIAPFFVTYALTYAQLAERFKELQKTLRGLIEFTADDEAPRLDWVKDMLNGEMMQKWADSMPMQGSYRAPAMQEKSYSPQIQSQPAAAPAQASVPVTAPRQNNDVEYVGPQVMNSQGQIVQLPPPTATQPAATAGEISPEEYMRNFASNGSAFTVAQTTKSMLKAYVDGYAKFWDDHIAKYRQPPHNMPHPNSVPRGMLPPYYNGNPGLPMGYTPGGPMTAALPVNGMGMPMMGGTMPMMGAGMPVVGNGMPMVPPGMMVVQTAQGPMLMPATNAGMPVVGGSMYPGAMGYNTGGVVVGTATNYNAANHPAFANSLSNGQVIAGTL